jgi:excinuclease UvrABC ATPase subunit
MNWGQRLKLADLGPEGDSAGGEVLFEGPPHALKNCTRSLTARFI